MSVIQKAFAITDAKISFVSLVDKAANKKQFLITKAEDGQASFSSFGKILKSDEQTHYVTGVVYEPMAEDTDGNYMTSTEIAKACHWFAKNGDKVDVQHSFEKADGVSVVENYIAPCNMEIGGQKITKGTWIMTAEVTDNNLWDSIQKGDITGFSMGGVGKISDDDVSLDDDNDDVTKSDTKTADLKNQSEAKGIFKRLASYFGFDAIEKGDFKTKYQQSAKVSNFWTAFDTLRNVLNPYDNYRNMACFETDETKITEALQEFSDVITELLTSESVAKSLYKSQITKKDEGDEMTEKDVKKIVEEVVDTKIKPILDKIEKSADVESATEPAESTPAAENHVTADQVGEIVEKAISKAVEPLLNARGIATNLNDDDENIEKSDDNAHYLHGIL